MRKEGVHMATSIVFSLTCAIFLSNPFMASGVPLPSALVRDLPSSAIRCHNSHVRGCDPALILLRLSQSREHRINR